MKKVTVCSKLILALLLGFSVIRADAAPRCRVKVAVKSGKGTVSGAGVYTQGKTISLKAKPASGYRFLRWAACCEDFEPTVAAASTLRYRVEESTTLYAYFKKKPVVPKPSISTSSTRIKLSWKKSSGASYYIIRRGKSKNYANSAIIDETSGTTYYDYHCWEEGTFYYWILPVDSTGKAFVSKAKYKAGRAKLKVSVFGSSSLSVGDVEQYVIGRACSVMGAGKYAWKIISGGKYATLSSTGVLRAKKAGKVVIQATYKKKKAKKTIVISKDCPECSFVASAVD